MWPDGDVQSLSRDGSFVARHVNVARPGVAIQINAFNFPVWGMLEKLAPAFLAGVPTIVKPATPTAYLAEAVVRSIIASDLLPEGSLQLVAGDISPIFSLLDEQDAISFTGSAETARQLKTLAPVTDRGVRFSAEADSLNAAVLAPSATPGTAEFDLFCDAVLGEMTAKAGQKCTAIRRVIVPDTHLDPVSDALVARLEAITVGHPPTTPPTWGPSSVWSSEPMSTPPSPAWGPHGVRAGTLRTRHRTRRIHGADSVARRRSASSAAHVVEPFGPVSTLLGYQDLDGAVALVAKGRGSLVASVFGPDTDETARITLGIAPFHGRVHTIDATSAAASTGHGHRFPARHGGPGRAGGG